MAAVTATTTTQLVELKNVAERRVAELRTAAISDDANVRRRAELDRGPRRNALELASLDLVEHVAAEARERAAAKVAATKGATDEYRRLIREAEEKGDTIYLREWTKVFDFWRAQQKLGIDLAVQAIPSAIRESGGETGLQFLAGWRRQNGL